MTGIIVLQKPKDITSFLAVAKTRRLCQEKKAGHAGTLDPMATGVLPILFGGATRFLEFVPTSPKRYRAVLRLGLTTDTLDITGQILSEQPVSVSKEDLQEALENFRGEIFQVPPMYSAIKKDGVRMYDLARQGIEVEREARPVTIFELNLLSEGKLGHALGEQEYALDVLCSSGTYIRTLIDDLGRQLGCGAVMTELTRTAVGPFTMEHAVTLEELEAAAEAGTVEDYLLSVEDALKDYPKAIVSEAQAKRFRNGGELDLDRIPSLRSEKREEGRLKDGSYYGLFGPEQEFLGLGEVHLERNQMTVKRVFMRR